MEHSSGLAMFTIHRVAVVEGNRTAGEMLHTFFRLMELECSLVRAGQEAVPTLRRLRPDVVILDLDLPHLRALEIARGIRTWEPELPVVLLTDREPELVPFDAPVVRKPYDRFEELLGLLELMLKL
jgi:CheY-like chemotaxis protein